MPIAAHNTPYVRKGRFKVKQKQTPYIRKGRFKVKQKKTPYVCKGRFKVKRMPSSTPMTRKENVLLAAKKAYLLHALTTETPTFYNLRLSDKANPRRLRIKPSRNWSR